MDQSAREAAPRNVKRRPTASAMLWGHLLSGKEGSALASTPRGLDVPPMGSQHVLTPVDKTGTSLRILLHDTQAYLEKFSDQVTKLTLGVDESRREINTVTQLFQEDREKLVEEMVDVVNRCQSEIQRTVGNPAQAPRIDDMRSDLDKLNAKLAILENKMDMLQLLNQTQLQALQTVQDQQGNIIAAITPVLPLLQSIPLHIEAAKSQVQRTLNDVTGTQAAKGLAHNSISYAQLQGRAATISPQTGDTPSASSSVSAAISSGQRKKRKVITDDNQAEVPIRERAHCTVKPATQALTAPVCNAAVSSHLPASATPSQRATVPQPTSSRISPISEACLPLKSSFIRSPFQTPRRLPLAGLQPPSVSSATIATVPTSSRMINASAGACAVNAAETGSVACPTASPLTGFHPAAGRNAYLVALSGAATPKNANSLLSTTSTMSQSSDVRVDPVFPPDAPQGHNRLPVTPKSNLPPTGSGCVRAEPHTIPIFTNPGLISGPAATAAPPRRDFHQVDVSNISQRGPNVAWTPFHAPNGKPMSIKALTATPAFRNKEKRFIPLDDDDEEDLG